MMKTYFKNEKGITISILVITILVMIILAGIGIAAIAPGGVLEKTEKIKEDIPFKQAIVEVHNALDYKYYLNSGRKLTEADEGVVESVVKIIKETGISPNKFVIYYDKVEGEIYKDLIFYRYDLITADELDKISNYDEVSGMFMGDANLDGVLSNEDLIILNNLSKGIPSTYYEENKDIILKLGDFDANGNIDGTDIAKLNAVLENTQSIWLLYKGGK